MFKTPPKGTTVIVNIGRKLSDDDIDAELKTFTENQKAALTQLLSYYRQDYADKAPTNADANNALGMARDNGAAEALSNLITVLNDKWTAGD